MTITTMSIELINADARSLPLTDGSVQMVCTSPPYWGLRKYAGEQESVWGGRLDCGHEWQTEILDKSKPGTNGSGLTNSGESQAKSNRFTAEHGTCRKCGAWRGAYGLEPTVEMYVAHTVEILREIRRVLRDDGVVFWNIGDSYASQGGPEPAQTKWQVDGASKTQNAGKSRSVPSNLKPKDLCLIPFRVALAAQGFATVNGREILACADTLKQAREAGDWGAVQQVETLLRIWSSWSLLDSDWVRQVIIWSKPNPMPESTTDRPTTSHEYILLLTKQPRYFWDAEAVREPAAPETAGRRKRAGKNALRGQGHFRDGNGPANRDGRDMSAIGAGPERNMRSVWEFATQPMGDRCCSSCSRVYSSWRGLPVRVVQDDDGNDKREVQCTNCHEWGKWVAHFATFPEKLARRCILAGTSERGACSKCGAPWVRQVKATGGTIGTGWIDHTEDLEKGMAQADGADIRCGMETYRRETVGWNPSCECDAGAPVPCVVLDPFAGSGTVGRVALELNRRAVLCDIAYSDGGEYRQLAEARTRNVQPQLHE